MTPATLKPIAKKYAAKRMVVTPGERLHRLVARLFDTHVDDMTDAQLENIERAIDELRITHSDGSPL